MKFQSQKSQILILILVFCVGAGVFHPGPAQAQLRELEVKPEDPPSTIPVFRNYPDQAAVIIYSSLTNLDITSNMGIVADQSRPADGRYELLIGPFRQILTVRAPGYQETRISIPNLSAREVVYFSVEPKEREPVTGRGTLILRSIPEGARITVDGIPDFEQRTPYTFADWSAQSYRIRVTLDKYDPVELVISIPEGRAISRTLELLPDHGFVTIHQEGTLRVRYHGEGSLSRISYTAGRPLELPVGRHTLELSRDNYETAVAEHEIQPGGRTEWRPPMTATYGFIVVQEQGTLRIRYHGQEVASRVDYQAGRPLQVPVGRHVLELTRDHYETETANITVAPGERAAWRPDSRPTYGRLRVRANTQVRVDVADNQAPAPPPGANYLNVEAGRKQVRVTAPDYVADEFSIDMAPGGQIDTTITLLSVAEARDLERRREQPRGVIMAAADLAATEIWVNGEMAGRGFANVTVVTGRHEVEFRHATGNRRQSVYVAPAEMEHVFIELRPSRARAVTLGTLLPGGGHIYTNRSRGYVYGAAFLGAAAGTYLMWQRYDSRNDDYHTAMSDYETAQRNYRNARSREAAALYRNEIEGLLYDGIPRLHDDRSQAFEQFRYTAIGLAAIYTINLVDILISRPQYGYRTGRPPEGFSLSAVPAGGGNVSASLTWRVSF